MNLSKWITMSYCAFLVASILALFAVATPVRADWAEVPLEVLVDEADVIVVGKVTKVQDGGFFIIGPNKSDHIVKQDVAVVEISAILKAPAMFGKPKESISVSLDWRKSLPLTSVFEQGNTVSGS